MVQVAVAADQAKAGVGPVAVGAAVTPYPVDERADAHVLRQAGGFHFVDVGERVAFEIVVAVDIHHDGPTALGSRGGRGAPGINGGILADGQGVAAGGAGEGAGGGVVSAGTGRRETDQRIGAVTAVVVCRA